jgi:dual specificity tyrosine-phosphorylation-regulated kinase 2/3/4
VFFDEDYVPLVNPNSKGKIRKPNTKNLAQLIDCEEDPAFVDFIDQCFEWKPDKRLTPEVAF